MSSTQRTVPVVTADLIQRWVSAPVALRPWISAVGVIPTVTGLSLPFTHAPDATTTIVVHAPVAGPATALVFGPRTRATYSRAESPAASLHLRLAPGAARSLLGIGPADLVDRAIRLADVPAAAAGLTEELHSIRLPDVPAYLAETLPRRVAGYPAPDRQRLLTAAVAEISSSATGSGIAHLPGRLGVSERRLRDLFTTEIGISPKYCQRIGRVRRVLACAGHLPWAALAAAAGYYDQSHMTAEFRSLMGVPPNAFLRGDLPPARPCHLSASDS